MDRRCGSRDRSCFIHAGTHKTGTTAIQRFLAGNREPLARAGFYYPRSGCWHPEFPGHHNLMFELTGDARFDPAAGTLSDLVRELARERPANACLSSEAFEYLHVREDVLVALRDALAGLGYRPRVVLYVRAQDDYAESLYTELVKHRSSTSFTEFLDGVIAHGIVRYGLGGAYRFDYTKLADGFGRVFGADAVIVRRYRDEGTAGALVDDFFDAVGVTVPTAGQPPAYDNFRLTTGGVIRQLFANTAAHLRDDGLVEAGAEFVARFADEASAPFRPLGPRDRARVTARFAGDNAQLGRRWPAAADLAEPSPARRLESERERAARRLFEAAEAVRSAHAARAGRTEARSTSGGS
jgi:hypothetical protein